MENRYSFITLVVHCVRCTLYVVAVMHGVSIQSSYTFIFVCNVSWTMPKTTTTTATMRFMIREHISNKRNENKATKPASSFHSINVHTQSKPNRFVRVNIRVNSHTHTHSITTSYSHTYAQTYVPSRRMCAHECVCVYKASWYAPYMHILCLAHTFGGPYRLSVCAACGIQTSNISQTVLSHAKRYVRFVHMLSAESRRQIGRLSNEKSAATYTPTATSDKATKCFTKNNQTMEKSDSNLIRWKI